MNRALRITVAAIVAALLGWVGVGIYRAGGDVPPPPGHPDTQLSHGHAEGRRVDGKPSWSLDYDRLTASADTTTATLENVRHGILYRHGKPFMNMRAKHVIVNTISNDFVVTGPLELTQNAGKHSRRLSSDAATYSGVLQTLTLNHPTDVNDNGTKVTFATATVNFQSGDMALGRLVGVY